MAITLAQFESGHRYRRWKGILPGKLLDQLGSDGTLMTRLGDTPTIAILGDIRRSQDLMTYSESPDSFFRFMSDFLSETRRIVDTHLGIFDKFTGDGFVAYFNQYLCGKDDRDALDCFLGFVAEETAFANAHFAQWITEVRKLPDRNVGLAMGADLGKVAFRDMNNHFVAVGDAIVWASRMASEGAAGEVVMNNLLWRAVESHWARKPELTQPQEERVGKTKAGESFLAWVIKPQSHWTPVATRAG